MLLNIVILAEQAATCWCFQIHILMRLSCFFLFFLCYSTFALIRSCKLFISLLVFVITFFLGCFQCCSFRDGVDQTKTGWRIREKKVAKKFVYTIYFHVFGFINGLARFNIADRNLLCFGRTIFHLDWMLWDQGAK